MENETEDMGIEDVNIAFVTLNSSKRKKCYEINWISFFFFFFRMTTVYQKINAICVHMLQSYDNYSQIQICCDNTRKNFNLYRAYPDTEEGSRFMRDMFLEISKSNIYKLCQCVKKLIRQNEDDKIVMEISKTSKERFVIESHDTFKNIILGYQKRKTTPEIEAYKIQQ